MRDNKGHAGKFEPVNGVKNKVDPSRTDVLDHDILTNETDFVDEDATIRIKAIREARVMLDEIIKNDSTTALYRCQPQAARVSWMRRVLSWFKTS